MYLSKGHCPHFIHVLAEKGFFDKEELKKLKKNLEQCFKDIQMLKKIPGVDVSTGSLGQGVSRCCRYGIRTYKYKKSTAKVYTVLGDGELQEGLVWEAYNGSISL